MICFKNHALLFRSKSYISANHFLGKFVPSLPRSGQDASVTALLQAIQPLIEVSSFERLLSS